MNNEGPDMENLRYEAEKGLRVIGWVILAAGITVLGIGAGIMEIWWLFR